MENWMQGLTPGQVGLLIIGGLMALAGFINTVGSAAEKVAKAWRAAKAPNAAQDERLDDHEDRLKRIENQLNRGNDRFENLDAGERVTQRALLALLDHGIDGNNIEQMQHAKEELQNHLINR